MNDPRYKTIEETVVKILRDLLTGQFGKVSVEMKEVHPGAKVTAYIMGARLIRIDINLGEGL